MGNNKKSKGNKKKALASKRATPVPVPVPVAVTPTESPSSPPAIPQDSISSTRTADSDSRTDKTSSQTNSQPPQRTAAEWKQEGNAAFALQKFPQAAAAYRAGLAAVAATATATATATIQNSDETEQLRIHLHSNLAMVLLKMHDYATAEQECSAILPRDDKLNGNGGKDTGAGMQAKIWYRRGMARDGRAKSILALAQAQEQSPAQSPNPNESKSESSTSQAADLWKLARDDLRRAMELLDAPKGKATTATKNTQLSEKERDHTKRSVLQVAVSVQRALQSLEQSPQDMSVSGNNKSKKSSAARTASASMPSPEQQRQDVLRLLVARQLLLQQHSQKISTDSVSASTSTSTATTAPALPGEAFFLIDWDWWCDWCAYVDAVGSGTTTGTNKGVTSGNGNSSNKQVTLVSYLPPGAVLPAAVTHNDGDDDDDSVSSGGPPGVIDNSHLFLVPPPAMVVNGSKVVPTTHEVFCRQWYQSYSTTDATAAGASNSTTPDHSHDKNHIHYPLQPNLVRGYHYELLPREVYFALSSWYGEALPSVCRRTSELVHRNGETTPTVYLPLYPLSSREGILPATAPANSSSVGSIGHSHCGACRAPRARLRCTRCMSVYYCDRSCQESHWPFHKGGCTVVATTYSTSTASATTASANGRGQGVATRQQQQAEASDGRVGLNNIGNTCFMNSALQCLSHATPLTRLFLSNKFRTDLNTTNPLGTGGKLVHAYEIVMKDLWMRLTSGSTSPTTLKRAIALFAPRFAGCLQHDTQEFLAYLLDGLHEDLNRIRKAPYVEMPDVTDGQNMAVASARAWDAHQRRNNSLLMDTFYGQFKSTCVCPKCNRVSVAFDTFNHVSLEIPQVKNAIVAFQALVFRAPTPDAPATKAIRYGLELRRSDRVGDLKQALSAMCGIPVDQLMLCEAQNSRISDLLNDNLLLSKLRSSDLILAYEADPVVDECYQAIASHRLVDPSVDPTDEKKIAASVDNFFGFPFLSSFSKELTCRQVWEHVWRHVGGLVESGSIKREDAQDLLKVRFTDERGIPQLVFPAVAGNNVLEDESLSADPLGTSVLPKDSDEKLVTFLGEESTGRFIFMALDWRDPEVETDDDEAKKVPVLDEDRFVAFENHPSFVEAMQKQRATKATKGVTLSQCFDTFTKPERLDEDNMWYCSQCKEHVRAMKTMELWRLPNILVVHLKRFEFKHALRRDKLDTLVDFPLEGLDMSVHCAVSSTSSFVDKTVPADYDLFAVTNHFGRMGFGHYTAYARRWDESGISDNWDLFDDSNVRSVGDGMGQTASVVSPAAYVLFYRRRIFH